MSDSICRLCGGDKASHYATDGKTPITQHVFDAEGTNLVTHAQKKQAQDAQQHQRMMITPATAGGTNLNTGRLVEVLLEKGMIDVPEALYIAGMGTKPGGN